MAKPARKKRRVKANSPEFFRQKARAIKVSLDKQAAIKKKRKAKAKRK